MGDPQDWQTHFAGILKAMEVNGVDFINFHPRYAKEKLKRPAQWKFVEWLKSRTGIPIVLSGDITSPDVVGNNPSTVGLASGFMIARMAACRPWIFKTFKGEKAEPDYAEVWTRYVGYLREDFQDIEAAKRLKEFTAFYSRNFIHSHHFFTAVSTAGTLEEMNGRGMEFLSESPPLCAEPSFSGI